jgi:hypothetical protein
MLNTLSNIRHDIIREDVDQYEIKEWIGTKFVNVGEASAEIRGITYLTGDIFDASVGNYPVVGDLSIKFTGEGTKKIVVNYGVLVKKC